MDWSQLALNFQWDGSLRDIYIRGTSAVDWEQVWSVLISDPERLSFQVDGEAVAPPPTVREVFEMRAFHSPAASYALGKQRLNCHFFLVEEVEFDLDPCDVDGRAEAENLATFMADLGRRCSKEVRLTLENMPEAVIAQYDPAKDEVIWIPAAL